MDEIIELLKQNQLSEEAISLYINCLDKPELTEEEIIELIPEITSENIPNVIKELINANLLHHFISEKRDLPDYYLTKPPFSIILKNILDIHESILANQESIKNSIEHIFKGETKIELNSAFNQFQMLAKEHTEATSTLKKNFENNMEVLKKTEDLKKSLGNLEEIVSQLSDTTTTIHQNIRGVTQSQFGNLIKILKTIKTQLGIEVKKLNIKDIGEVMSTIEEVFSSEFNEMVDNFTETIFSLIDLEFQNFRNQVNQILEESIKQKVQEPITSITSDILNVQNDSKMIISNLINSFDANLEEIKRILITKKDIIPNSLRNLEEEISNNINEILQDSTKKILELKDHLLNIDNKIANAPKHRIIKVEEAAEEESMEPKSGDKIGALINNAFNKLLKKVEKLQGYEFSNELQKISDVIFEKAGFSVSSTLHKISTTVSYYKPLYENLKEEDLSKIFDTITIWKKEIFSKTGQNL